jgi:predicted N-formylglutamate amidohydrolase
MSSAALHNRADDWPEAVVVLNEAGRSDTVLLCEHASNHMPAEYNRLGLSENDLQRHIAWDIGAALLTHRLSALLDAPAFLSTYSRLLIDLNRPLGSEGSMPTLSEDTIIPGNGGIDEAERTRREAIMFKPFHDKVSSHLADREKDGRPTRIVTVHSFTPTYLGISRPWHAGVLFAGATELGTRLVDGLRNNGQALNVDANVPYVINRDSDYAIPVHGDDRGHDAVLIEIRQDLLTSSDDIDAWAHRLVAALPAFRGEMVA